MTLLLSILMLSMVLATSLSVSYLIMTGIKLSETVRESQLAYYAADSSVECALYVDLQVKKGFGFGDDPKIETKCNGAGAASQLLGSTSWKDGAAFRVTYANGSCADVTVAKGAQTTITAVGYNTCQAVSRRVNRSLSLQY